MANNNLIFPIGFDLEAGIKKAEKDLEEMNRRLADAAQRVSAAGRGTGTTNTIQRELMERERVNKSMRETYNEQEKVAELIGHYHDIYENQVESLVKLTQQLAANKKAQSDNTKALKDGAITQEEYNRKQIELVAQQRQLTLAKSHLTQIMKAEEKATLAQEGSYDHLSQQLSLLKRAYKELSEEGRTSPFGQELEMAIQNLDAHLKDMAADMGEFQRNVGNYAIAGQNGVVSTNSLTAAINQQAKTIQDLIDQTRILEDAKRMLNKDDANYRTTLTALNAKLDENKRELSDVNDILGKKAKSVAEAEDQNKRLSEAIKHVDLNSAGANAQIKAMREQIERNNKTIANATGANEKYASSLLSSLGINENFGSSLQSLGEDGNFFDGLKTKVQAFGETLKGIISNPKMLIFLGITGVATVAKWWYDYNKGLVEATKVTQDLTGLTGDAMKILRNEVQAVADTYGHDFKEMLVAVNALSKQFGISVQEAMRLVKDGFITGADANGEFLDILREYPAYFSEAGISASEFIAITSQATKAGVYSDKGVDAIKEGNLRIREMTTATAAALDALGISSAKVQEELANGSKTTFDIMQMVSAKLAEFPESATEVGTALADIFGGPGEDAGLQYILTLKDIDTNLDNVKERAGELGKIQEEQLQSQIELENTIASVFDATGGSFESMTAQAKIFINKGIIKIIKGCADIVNWFIKLYNEAIYVRVSVANIVFTFKTLWTVVKGVFEVIVNLFKSVGDFSEALVLILSGKFKEGAEKMKDAFVNNFNRMKNTVLDSAKEIGKNFADSFNGVVERRLKPIKTELITDEEGGGTSGTGGSGKKNYNKSDSESGSSAAQKAMTNRLQILTKIEQVISEIYNKYDELVKKEGETKALEHINRLYGTRLRQIKEMARQFGWEFDIPTSFDVLQGYRKSIRDEIKQIPGEEAAEAFSNLDTKIELANIDKLAKDIEKELQVLGERISRTKTAKEFYDRVLGMTGDIELASRVSLQIYGSDGSDLDDLVKEQFSKTFESVKITHPEVAANVDAIINRGAFGELLNYINLLPESQRKAAEALVREQQRISSAQYDQWLKDLEMAKSYSDKLIALSRYTANQIADIQSSDLDQGEKNRLIAGYNEREVREAEKLEYEAFINTPLYTQMFEDLENASTFALESMRNRLIALRGEWKNLEPTQIKELQERLDEIDAQLARRNPFTALGDAWKKWQALRKSGRTRAGDEAAAQAAEDARNAALEKMVADKEAYQHVVATSGAESDAAKAAREVADASKQAYDAAEKTANETAKSANEWKTLADGIDNANAALDEYQDQVNQALDGVLDMMEALGADAADMEFFRTVKDGLNQIFDGAQAVAKAVGDFSSGKTFSGVMSSVGAITSIVSGISNIFYAGKIRKANKEIERQQEVLEQLEYTYGRLEKAAEKLFGADYLSNYNTQIRNLRAQMLAYQKQAEAERSKGKKADKEKIKEYEEAIRDTADEIKAMQEELTAKFLGSDRTSLAREFAESWLDAKASFASTTDAIKSKYKDMIRSMIVEGAAAKLIDNILAPMWEQMDKKLEGGDTAGAIDYVVNGLDSFMQQADNGLNVLWKSLEAKGYDLKELLGDAETNQTGIAKQVASASSEEINAVAAIGNTLLYYNSKLPVISDNIAIIRQILEVNPAVNQSRADASILSQQAMDNLVAIERHTAETVIECRNIAAQCQEQVTQLRRVITPKNSSSAVNAVQVRIV